MSQAAPIPGQSRLCEGRKIAMLVKFFELATVLHAPEPQGQHFLVPDFFEDTAALQRVWSGFVMGRKFGQFLKKFSPLARILDPEMVDVYNTGSRVTGWIVMAFQPASRPVIVVEVIIRAGQSLLVSE